MTACISLGHTQISVTQDALACHAVVEFFGVVAVVSLIKFFVDEIIAKTMKDTKIFQTLLPNKPCQRPFHAPVINLVAVEEKFIGGGGCIMFSCYLF